MEACTIGMNSRSWVFLTEGNIVSRSGLHYLSMMKPNLLVRGITLSGFAVLMSGFVAYKAGAFESGGDSNSKADSPVKDTVQEPIIFAPSSKSGPVFTPKESKDTSKPQQQQHQGSQSDQTPNQNAAPPKQKTYMGGSKSKQVFTPEPKDTSKPK